MARRRAARRARRARARCTRLHLPAADARARSQPKRARMRPAMRCALSSARRRSPAAPSASSSHACSGREGQRPRPRRGPSLAAARWALGPQEGAAARGVYWRLPACPLSTRGGTRCVHSVRGEGQDVSSQYGGGGGEGQGAPRHRCGRPAPRRRQARCPSPPGPSASALRAQPPLPPAPIAPRSRRRERAAREGEGVVWAGGRRGFTSGSNSADDASLSITELPRARALEQARRRAGRHAPGVAHLLMLPVSSGSQPASASMCSVLSRVDCSTPPCARPAQVADRDRSVPCPSSRVARDVLCEAACCVCSASCLRSSLLLFLFQIRKLF